ncbi:MAG: FecR domain-containing protein [Lacibacter sp.]
MPENILVLIEKYHNGKITAAEKKTLDDWYHSYDDSFAEIHAGDHLTEQQLYDRIRKRLIVSTVSEEVDETKKVNRKKYFAVAASVALLVFLSAGIYFIFSSKTETAVIVSKANHPPVNSTPIIPGGNKAVLILSDGSSVILDSSANGTITSQGNIEVVKLKNGLLAYNINGKLVTENDELFYNTISTPRGGQYQVTLSDGTNVWLNAASSIRFPVVFTGKERRIEITGEAYLEVAKNALMPFIVEAASSEIQVLGTHFNVNAYTDETAIKTTLLEGSVKISAANNKQTARVLKPGQQLKDNRNGEVSIINKADTEEALAWKNGLFIFKSANVKEVMRQISRWYNVEVEYKGNVNLHFTGQLKRNEDVKDVFEKIALTEEVRFKIDGRKIIVSP